MTFGWSFVRTATVAAAMATERSSSMTSSWAMRAEYHDRKSGAQFLFPDRKQTVNLCSSILSLRRKRRGLVMPVRALSPKSFNRARWFVSSTRSGHPSRNSRAFHRHQNTTRVSPSMAVYPDSWVVRCQLPHSAGCHPPLQQKGAFTDEQVQ